MNFPGEKIVGCILSTDDHSVFLNKQNFFDQIEGYTGEEGSSYQRSIVTAYAKDGSQKVCYMYHCTNSQLPEHDESIKVPANDWLKRTDKTKPTNIKEVIIPETVASKNGVQTDSNGKQITAQGFNMTDATLDEKMEYLQTLYSKMNKNYKNAFGKMK